MRVRPAILLVTLVAGLALAMAASARRLMAAQDRLDAAGGSLAAAVSDGQRVLELRQKQQRIAENRRPEQDVIARVNSALVEAGIPQDRFAGLRPSSDTALPGAGEGGPAYRRQTVQVTLRQLILPELGAFLAAWRDAQDLWVPSRIDLTHARDQGDAGRYDLTMLISATYVAER